MVDMIVAEAPAEDGGGFFLDARARSCRRSPTGSISTSCAPRCMVEDLSEVLGVMAVWDGARRDRVWPLLRRPAPARRSGCAACCRRILPRTRPPISAPSLVEASEYEAHRIALGAPRGGLDFHYNDAFPHEADMDQLNGVDFEKGCYVGQEVVSRVEHRGTARKRVVPVTFEDFGPEAGVPVKVGDVEVGMMGSFGRRHAALRCCASTASATRSPPGAPLMSGGIALLR